VSANWEVAKSSRKCCLTGNPIAVGETYYSALVEEGDTFVRRDYCVGAWEQVDPVEFFSYWKTRYQPEEEKEKKFVIDIEAFYTFFTRLAGATEPTRQLFRYVIALILVRKRALRLDEIEKAPDGEFLRLHDRRADETLRVPTCAPTPDQLVQVQESLNQIFECQIGPGDF
jgi:hypothetical protein